MNDEQEIAHNWQGVGWMELMELMDLWQLHEG